MANERVGPLGGVFNDEEGHENVKVSKLAAAFHQRRSELAHAAVGAGLGIGYSVCSLALDMQIRSWRGFDGSLPATFISSSMHSIALLSPFVLGRLFWAIGCRERSLRTRIKQIEDMEAHLRNQAHRDALTGLYNRAHMTRQMEEGIATREWARRGVLLYMLDLDDFKHVNDTFGHRAGDMVLIEIARRLAQAAGPDDMAVRLGGDEFILVHFPTADETLPELFAEKLIESVGREIELEACCVHPGTSIGIARVASDGSTWSEIVRAADIALYEAKSEANSSYCLFEPHMRVEKDRLSELESDMRRGIEAGEFELHYQPIYGTRSGTIRSFEALVRWNHPVRGQVPPLEFIPLAESSGLIVKLGRVILEEACRTAASWPKPIGVAVNLSPTQFNDPQLVRHVADALQASGLAPGRLDIEVTESLLLEASPRIMQTMKDLQRLGARVTMDDFGSGFSSLNNLRAFRFDRLKIDRSYTREIESAGEEAEIVRTVVRLARTLGMETVLEGVETEHQLVFAQNEGLTEVQGFFYARPMTRSDVAALLEARATGQVVDSREPSEMEATAA